MQQTRTVEMGTGLFALLGMGALFFLTTHATGSDDFNADETFEVTARFENVGSLRKRAPVSMSGPVKTTCPIRSLAFTSASLRSRYCSRSCCIAPPSTRAPAEYVMRWIFSALVSRAR